ncbi:autotransporter domain-containing protein [Sphingomonas sp. HF-S4]|uniref:Autotransporter domain-containing protein n=1 Tax=Sphingomonas agrestis TaxID=3080540 RepID=A0ABU3Y442_9SPHN|nr:autotransporter domain-containing protein [Sphingomonas sp. HF-S4]MDV3456156.1 autotransporter domain-containing protein [Sphingomonas sp. HF-S4]
MTGYSAYVAPPGAALTSMRRRKTAKLATLAASVSFAAIASPAYAQCVEGPPSNFTCSGTTNVSQVIVSDDATVTADPNFEVDTSGNGNGVALQVTGAGAISFTGGPILTGAGARFSTTGASGSSAGELLIVSSGRIIANGSNGLRLDNNGGGSTAALWGGAITNSGGNGVFARNFAGSGELFLLVGRVNGRDDGIRVEHGGSETATITATGAVVGDTAAGVRISTLAGAGGVDLTVSDVTGGTFGIFLDNEGGGISKVDATGTVTGLDQAGIRVSSGANTLGIDIRAVAVNGADNGIMADHQGSGDLSIVATGQVTGASQYGILASNQAAAGNLSITASDVIGDTGIRAINGGTGATTLVTTGDILGFGTDGISVDNDVNATDILIDVHNVTGAQRGIRAQNLGSGSTVVRSNGAIHSVSSGVFVETGNATTTALIDVADVISDTTAVNLIHSGSGVARVNATGNVVGTLGSGIAVDVFAGSTDIRVDAVNVTGGNFGIRTLNEGTGETFIAVTGLVKGGGSDPYGYGILAQNRDGQTTDLIVRAAEVQATLQGILAESDGLGTMTVLADKVTSQDEAAVRVLAEGAVSAVNVAIGEATGGTTGIEVVNLASGSASIDASGTVTGLSEYGIYVENGVNSTGIDIRANQVNGNISGIQTDNQGSGDTAIVATGAVVGGGNGISAFNAASARDISITATDVSGFYGIRSFNEGTGATSITATGLVDGTDYGVVAENASGATDMNIRVADVIANGIGMEVVNAGSGTTNVVADNVTGLGGVGVRISAEDFAGSVDLTVGDVTGDDAGAVIANSGIGAARLTATGTVTGANNIGINVLNDFSATDIEIHAYNVNGNGFAGILAFNDGTGDTLVETTGLVANIGVDGIGAVNRETARNLSVSAVDVIGGFGIAASNFGTGSTDVVSTGTVTGYSFDGVTAGNIGAGTDLRVEVNVVNGDDRGVRLRNEGTGSTRLRALGSVTGATGNGIEAAISATALGLTVDVVDVTGTSGIVIDNQGLGTTRVAATGTVTGISGNGINAFAFTQADDIEIDVADVIGNIGGVNVTNYGTGSASITASGTVSALAADGYGIVVETGTGSTDIRIAAADVLGNAGGIYTENLGSGETAITSSGTVTGGFASGIFARNDAGSTDLTIAANTVVGAEDGIATEHVGTGVTRIAAASATGTNGAGVFVQAEGTAGAVDLTLGDATGATYGILAYNYGTGTTEVETTGAVAGAADAGIAIENGAGATGIDLRAAQVAGENYGIQMENLGAGNTSVVATGPVIASAGMGMFVFNDATAANIRLEAARVQGAETGMLVVNQGTGTTSISASGLVTGTNVAGIDARAGVTAQGLTVSAVDVTGASGITVQNFGQGSAGISATGTVTALDATGTGIAMVGGTGSIDLSVASVRVVGGTFGVDTENQGSGDTLILASGLVTAGEVGIRAHNGAGAEGLGIRSAQVQSAGSGIIAENLGTGRTVVRADGAVNAQGEAGIGVTTGATADDVAVLAGTVSGGLAGIWVENEGIGSTSITASGAVSGTDFGITGRNSASATDLTIRATDAQGGINAVTTENLGTGETRVITTGNVVAQGQFGIRGSAGAGAGDIVIETANASGGISGVSAVNLGLGDTSITVSGTVHGATRGIEAFADGNQSVIIVNNGTVRNTSGLASARAIGANGGGVGIGNAGTLIGTVEIAGDQSLLVNSGSWRSIGGTSNFATVNDTLLNSATGTLVGGTLAGTVETTIWQGLERFRNEGALRLQDGGIGDLVQTSAATTFTSGSLLAVDVAGTTGADLYRTSGTVTIKAGSRLNVVAAQPLVLHGKHVVVQADGGLTGQFAFEDQMLTAFAGVRDGYTATTAFIEFAQLKAFEAAGLTPNQKETGAAADALPDGNALKDALLLLPNDAAAQEAFDQLSGEIHPSARSAMFDDSRLVRNAVLDRLAGGVPGWTAWARGFGASGQNDGDFNAAQMNRDTRGGVIGVDRAFGPATIGIAGGWTDTDLQVDRRASNGSVRTAHALAYAGASLGPVQLRGGLGYGWTTTETRRSIAFQGFADQTSARYKGSVLQAYGEAGYRLPLSGGYVEPFVNLTTVRACTDAFTEKGGLAALNGQAIRENRTGSTVGLRLETAQAGAISVRGSIGWNRAWGDLDPVGLHAFGGGAPFTVLGAGGSRDSALARFDAQMRLSSNVTLSLGYDGVLGARDDDHAITGGLKIVF